MRCAGSDDGIPHPTRERVSPRRTPSLIRVEDLFPGETRPAPPASSTGSAWVIRFGPDDPPPPPPVTHATGYEPFARSVGALGGDPAELARDVSAFGAFLHAHRDRLEAETRHAAAIFLGNLLVVLHPSATWISDSPAIVGTDARHLTADPIVEALADDPAASDRLLAELGGWDDDDARQQREAAVLGSVQAAADEAHLVDGPLFVSPSTDVGPLLDEHGSVVPYGDHYPGSPPEDAYSRVTHAERFTPLLHVASALVGHLGRYYAVEVRRSTDAEGRDVTDIVPAAGAPIRVTTTAFPGVLLRAGVLLDERFPVCGCDACDEAAGPEAERLIETVLGVVRGGFAERAPDASTGGATWLRRGDGSAGGSQGFAESEGGPADTVSLRALHGRAWPAWPLRSGSAAANPQAAVRLER